ncbi:Meiotically up-regulated protein [Lachnellula suecica]|uniref:Meiotically up-regulated protein n=1 Tax=Lachnellula suecica TaxID=602035 RepID=A0A8T9CIJ9_9HELO|nr:Meiotically up-regulated protein [Lachnellula suecica]
MNGLTQIFQSPLRLIKVLRIISVAAVVLLAVRSFTSHASKWTRINSLPKVAYATLLLPDQNTNRSESDSDAYFLSARLLNYQLQHDDYTRTTRSIPFLVLVTRDVSSWKVDQLAREGATVVVVERFDVAWIEPGRERWRDVMIKLRLFELVDYERILFLDADTFLFKPMDGIFDDPAAQNRNTLQTATIESDEGPLPETYIFATTAEVMHTTHSYPPVPMSYFNAGFFLMSPSLNLYTYYTSLFKLPGRFDTTYPEQNLLNYAHRQEGNMPWARLSYSWNIVLPHPNDVKQGVASVHAKLWTPGTELQPIEEELQQRWLAKKQEMEKVFEE